jgi:hypothetical protein
MSGFPIRATDAGEDRRHTWQELQRHAGGPRGGDNGVECLAPVELPDVELPVQGVGQFVVSSFSSTLRRCATIEPA